MVDTRKIHSNKHNAKRKPNPRKSAEPLVGNISERNDVKILDRLVSWYREARESSITDLNYVLERELSGAMRFFDADAGTIYINEKSETMGNGLRFAYIKNKTLSINDFNFNYSNKVIPINTESIAGYVAQTRSVLSIPDVYLLNESTPYGFNKSFDLSSGYRSGSMLVAPLFGYVSNFLGVIQLINKNDESGKTIPFSMEDGLCIEIVARHVGGALDKALTARNHTLNLIKVATTFDPHETGAHAQRVTNIGMEIAKEMKVDFYIKIQLREIFQHGLILHDIGKIGIPSEILQKNGKLTESQFAIIRNHPLIGYNYFSGMEAPFNSIPAEIALNHHEKWSGNGYPNNKSHFQIPLSGRIAAVADVCEALCSRRSYKEPWPFEKVCELVANERGKQFDPDVVDAFLAVRENIYRIIMRDQVQIS
ncbi:MAG: HD domain-containing protein [Candidatus Micrarchaeota archaeon]|nr:HD domain-containing protein [Candidatus Micrarchaeota archaeon]